MVYAFPSYHNLNATNPTIRMVNFIAIEISLNSQRLRLELTRMLDRRTRRDNSDILTVSFALWEEPVRPVTPTKLRPTTSLS